MSAAVQAIAHSHIHSDWRSGESARAAALAEVDTHIDNLRACLHWLIAAGISVLDADLRRGRHKPRITVAASPLLYTLLKDDCASSGRSQPPGSALVYITWVAVRYECEIHWQEVAK